MDFIRKNKKTIQTVVGAAVMMLALFVVLFFIFRRCRAEFNADYTDTILWANAAVESGHFFNPDYWYAYFLPFSGIPLMIPIVAAFGLSYFFPPAWNGSIRSPVCCCAVCVHACA